MKSPARLLAAAMMMSMPMGSIAQESAAVFAVHDHGPVTIPPASAPCQLRYYKLPLDQNGKPENLTKEQLQSLLATNGIIFPGGGYAIYIVETGSLLLATTTEEHKALTEALEAD